MHSDLIKENMEQEFKSLIKPLINGLGLCAVVGMIAREVDNMNDERGDDIEADWELASEVLDIVCETLDLKYEEVDDTKQALERKDNLSYMQYRVDCLVEDYK